jgi:LmbE family N-acetylglucosaminyl deacetylase
VTLGVVVPHPDDAALSCSLLLAAHPGAHIVTVFDGGPAEVDHLPVWDGQSGHFKPGDDITGARRAEDEAAAGLVGATSHHLEFWDEQYRNDTHGYVKRDDLAASVAERLLGLCQLLPVSTWVMPLGIRHVDHQLTADACLHVARNDLRATEWWVCEDLPYWREFPTEREQRKGFFASFGFSLVPGALEISSDRGLKRRVIDCHWSQLGLLGAERIRLAMEGPELYHRLERAGDARQE